MTSKGMKVTALRRRTLAYALGCGVLLVTSFWGTARANVLVLDVCMEQCSEADWHAIGNLRRVLTGETKNDALVASVEEMVYHLGDHTPFPGISDPALTVEKLSKHIKDGIDQWTHADYEGAVDTLGSAISEATLNPAIVAADATLRRLVVRAYVGRAISLERLARPKDPKDAHLNEAKKAMADLARVVLQPSIQDVAGTKPDELFQKSRNDLVAQGMGSLSVQINDPTAVFYLDAAAGQPHTGAFSAEVPPGIYQIFVADAVKRSRRYRVEVFPHKHTVLSIDWPMDTKFEMSPLPHLALRSRIGFTFSSYVERRLFEADYAHRIAALVPGSLVLIVGRIKREGQDAMIGLLYAPEGPASRIGVVLGTDLPAARALVSFLMTSNKPSPQVISLAFPPWANQSTAPSAERAHAPAATTIWALVGGGTIAASVGASLYVLDHDPNGHASLYGIGIGAAGLTATGLGFWLGWDARGGPVVSLSSSRAVIGWAGSF
jgi:hypothetical protein